MSDALWKALVQAKKDSESKGNAANHFFELMSKHSAAIPDDTSSLFGGYTPVSPGPGSSDGYSLSSLSGAFAALSRPASPRGLSQNAFTSRMNPPEESLIGRPFSMTNPFSIPSPSSIPGIGPRLSLSSLLPPPVVPTITPAPIPAPIPAHPRFAWCRPRVQNLLRRVAKVRDARVLPNIDDLSLLEARRTRAAFVYSDLHGFAKLVATQPENKSFVFLDTFIHMANVLTKHYNGEVMNVAGDRVLSVFHRPLGDLSNEPVEDAVKFSLWLQTVFTGVIAPEFTGAFNQLSIGIGIDYGEAVVGCVGMKGSKHLVFVGDPANDAAKLQDLAQTGETVLSQAAALRRPAFLWHPSWKPSYEMWNGQQIMRINQVIVGEEPPS